MIYLDNAATTKALRSAIDSMAKYAGECFYNPSAGYAPALEIKKALSAATEDLASMLGAKRDELIFTSCATESNNFAFECGVKNKKGNIVVSAMEHASVYESAMRLKSRGADVRFIPLSGGGNVTEEALRTVVDPDTAFVSIIHVSNETGAINDISALCKTVKTISPRAVFHSDGVQAFCKLPTDMKKIGADLYSISAHKVGGLKGVGALFVRKGLNMQPFIVGGGQQNGRRSGTENVGGIIGFAEAAREYSSKSAGFDGSALRDIIIEKIAGKDWIKANGTCKNSGYILSLSFKALRGEVVAHMAEEEGVLIGLGSACSAHVRSNRVLAAMGVDRSFAVGSVRISFCPDTTKNEVVRAADIILSAAEKLRETING